MKIHLQESLAMDIRPLLKCFEIPKCVFFRSGIYLNFLCFDFSWFYNSSLSVPSNRHKQDRQISTYDMKLNLYLESSIVSRFFLFISQFEGCLLVVVHWVHRLPGAYICFCIFLLPFLLAYCV